jgi:hypothetical protein
VLTDKVVPSPGPSEHGHIPVAMTVYIEVGALCTTLDVAFVAELAAEATLEFDVESVVEFVVEFVTPLIVELLYLGFRFLGFRFLFLAAAAGDCVTTTVIC